MGDAQPRVRAIVSAATRPALPPHIKLRHDEGRGGERHEDGHRVSEPGELELQQRGGLTRAG